MSADEKRGPAWFRPPLKSYAWLCVPLVVALTIFQLSCRLPVAWRPSITTQWLPTAERWLFGTAFVYRWMGPARTWLLVAAAVPYLLHFALPVLVPIVVWRFGDGVEGCLRDRRRRKPQQQQQQQQQRRRRCQYCRAWHAGSFLWALGMLNLLGVATQLLVPTAPPWWYVRQLGDGGEYDPRRLEAATYDSPSSEARLVQVDRALDVTLFHSIYGQAPLVFGSFPSLHAAWPLLVAVVMWSAGWRWRLACSLYVAWIWWAAVYLEHHFVVDVLGAVVYVTAVEVVRRWRFGTPACACQLATPTSNTTTITTTATTTNVVPATLDV